ncbi:CYB2 (YML054C) [Zygosaccharomyces parabailii]|nr:CYB2 (YML054C) [Zygosaccharomyces parabailii]SJM86786.1 probable Cytochrome b2, mitochondrial [Zygosaccharomyces bailii]
MSAMCGRLKPLAQASLRASKRAFNTKSPLRGVQLRPSRCAQRQAHVPFRRTAAVATAVVAAAAAAAAAGSAAGMSLWGSPIANGTTKDMSKPAISADEVAKHNTDKSIWVVIDGYVYDLTEFVPVHPGGAAVIKANAGKDVTKLFQPIHPPDAIEKFIDPSKRLGPLKDPMPSELVVGPFTPGETAEDVQRKTELRSRLPPLDSLTNLYDFENLASQILTKQAWAYYSSGSDDEISLRENHSAYHRIFFKPKVLVNVSKVDTSTELLGEKVDVPFYASATALCKLGNPAEGEKDVARGCGMGPKTAPQMISTMASCSLEEICKAANKDQLQWFQLYVNPDHKVMENMIHDAEDMGCKAIFVTVDAPGFGNREKDAKIKFTSDISGPRTMRKGKEGGGQSKGAAQFMSKFVDASLSWEELAEIKKKTSLPLVVKGVQRVEDVIKAAEMGCSGVVLSNHGGRQLDFSRAPIEVLAEVSPILKEKNYPNFEVFVDGGIRRGTDVIKALCLGAKGVGLGRPILYANSTYGKEGVQKAIQLLNAEVEMSMRLLGVNSIKELGPELLDTTNIKARCTQVPRDFLYDKTYVSGNLADFLPPSDGGDDAAAGGDDS